LPKGEKLLMLHKPAMVWVVLRTPRRIAGLVVALAGLLVWGKLLGHGVWGYGAQAAGFGVLLLALQVTWNVLHFEARWYAVTENRLMTIGGVLGRYSTEMPLDSVRGIVVVRPLLERLLGVGSVGFGSAATGGLEVFWIAVPEADRLADRVRAQIADPRVTTTTRQRATKKGVSKKGPVKKASKKPPAKKPAEGGDDA
jgi:membrane protein YdbS with pleckstrin-like domain